MRGLGERLKGSESASQQGQGGLLNRESVAICRGAWRFVVTARRLVGMEC